MEYSLTQIDTNEVKEFTINYSKTNIVDTFIRSSVDGERVLRQIFNANDINIFEQFYIILLNQCNRVKGFAKISQGGLNGCTVDNRLIAKYAIETLSTSVILAHNHPSGNSSPSLQDKQMTNTISQALELFGIKVLDHIILTDEYYTSMADDGLM